VTLEHLFRPLEIGPVELPCRVVSASHQTTLVHDHLPTGEFVAYQQARAAGGVGLIIMEAVAIAPAGLLTSHTIGGYLDGTVAAYRRIADAVQPHGTRLFVQLFHGGRELLASAPRPVAVSSSALPSHRYHSEPRALRTAEVEETIRAYGRCAALAAEAELDGIEITAAHGYLAEQFFNADWNRRSDRYREGSRFVIEALEAVRASAPELALGVRLSADSLPAQAVVGELAGLVDYVHIAIGNSATFDGCVNIVPPPTVPRNAIADLTGPFRVGKPLIATSRVVDPVDADRLIGEGVADAFGMNRALITDPRMPEKARTGRARSILRCIGCNACIAHYHAETPIRCAQNPRTGRELTFPPTSASSEPQRIVVVGAGPAGLAAAAEAGAAGHDVLVLERTDRIGGQVWLAGQAPSHRELADSLTRNYEHLLDRPNVELRLGVSATADVVASHEPDVVVIATGARPYEPAHVLEDIEVVQVWDILAGARRRGHVVISDWGGDAAALDCAELLAESGNQVTLAVGSVMPGETLHQYVRNSYLGRLSRANVSIRHYLGLHSASQGAIRFRNIFAPELETVLEADVLALSLGRVPNDGLAEELRVLGLRVLEAGDCQSPRSLEEAILEGTLAGVLTPSGVQRPRMRDSAR
jgi:2,4-dienoyl-CoA reductase-like NADH-dependent reductase (Old Yellow Enzyme family)/thioredoxin reductase